MVMITSFKGATGVLQDSEDELLEFVSAVLLLATNSPEFFAKPEDCADVMFGTSGCLVDATGASRSSRCSDAVSSTFVTFSAEEVGVLVGSLGVAASLAVSGKVHESDSDVRYDPDEAFPGVDGDDSLGVQVEGSDVGVCETGDDGDPEVSLTIQTPASVIPVVLDACMQEMTSDASLSVVGACFL